MATIAPIERPTHDGRARFAVANFDFDHLAGGGRIFPGRVSHVRHRDRPLNRWREGPAGDDTGLDAVSKYPISLPRNHPTVVGLQPDQFFLQSLLALRGKRLLADKRTPQLYEDPKTSFQRRRIAIEFVAVGR